MDDIVTRLRDRLEESFCHCVEDPFFVCSYCAIEEAADEIERLRAGFRLMAMAYAADLGMDRHGWEADKMCEEYVRKAVRGE